MNRIIEHYKDAIIELTEGCYFDVTTKWLRDWRNVYAMAEQLTAIKLGWAENL
jgi:hypothetical protein